MTRNLTAIIQVEDGGFVAFCPQLDVCSQGATVEEARANLRGALEPFSRRLRQRKFPAGCPTRCT
jgi:predicted RNase H-like HicB family nuclease